MFGKPQWFRPKTVGWGLTPITWQGWLYTLCWAAVLVLPFLVLIWRHQPVEATAWLAIGIGALCYDVRQILHAIRHPHAASTGLASKERDDNVLFIGDSQAGAVATRNYNLQLRR